MSPFHTSDVAHSKNTHTHTHRRKCDTWSKEKMSNGIRIREGPNIEFIIQGTCRGKKRSMINMLKAACVKR